MEVELGPQEAVQRAGMQFSGVPPTAVKSPTLTPMSMKSPNNRPRLSQNAYSPKGILQLCGPPSMASKSPTLLPMSLPEPALLTVLQKFTMKPKAPSLLQRRRGAMALPMEMPPAEKLVDTLAALDDRYKVLEKLGSGSAAMVHRAIQLGSGREVALKMPRSNDPGVATLAKREYEMLKWLEPHPNIIQVVDFHDLRGEATLVLEYFDGSTLQAAVTEKRFPEHRAHSLGTKLMKAVAHLHANNILHRDVKPENVLVSRGLRDLRLIDLNVAACLDDGEPLTPTGTKLYKAPELLLGEPACERSDVWSTGLCIFFMLSGSLPKCCGFANRACALQTADFESDSWQLISGDCKAMLQECLELERESRPTMAELLESEWIADSFTLLTLLKSVVPGAQTAASVFNYLKKSEGAKFVGVHAKGRRHTVQLECLDDATQMRRMNTV